MRKLVNTSE